LAYWNLNPWEIGKGDLKGRPKLKWGLAIGIGTEETIPLAQKKKQPLSRCCKKEEPESRTARSESPDPDRWFLDLKNAKERTTGGYKKRSKEGSKGGCLREKKDCLCREKDKLPCPLRDDFGNDR